MSIQELIGLFITPTFILSLAGLGWHLHNKLEKSVDKLESRLERLDERVTNIDIKLAYLAGWTQGP